MNIENTNPRRAPRIRLENMTATMHRDDLSSSHLVEIADVSEGGFGLWCKSPLAIEGNYILQDITTANGEKISADTKIPIKLRWMRDFPGRDIGLRYGASLDGDSNPVLSQLKNVVAPADVHQVNPLKIESISAAALAHDLNKPLATIKMLADYLKLSASDTDREGKLGSTTDLADNISQLADVALVIAHSLFGRHDSDSSYLTIGTSIATVAESLKNVLTITNRDRNASVKVANYAGDVHAEVPIGELVRALLNVMQNGLDHSSDQDAPWIKLTIRRITIKAVEYVQFEVTDSGRGFDQKMIENLGQPWQSSKQTNPSQQSPRGLGLYIAKQVCAKYQGELVIAESQPNTTVVLRFPTI